METKISKQTKDLIQKNTSNLFKNVALDFYGIKTARIKELINVELPDVTVKASGMDIVFLLEDDTYLHLEFQTTYNKDDLYRFASYDIRLSERDRRNIKTVIIYTSDVKKANAELNIGSLAFYPDKVMMIDYDGNAIYEQLSRKIKNGAELSDFDMVNLIFLPLMKIKNTIPRDELAVNSIKLAQTIKDKTKQESCIAAAYAFAEKYLDENGRIKIWEVLKMSNMLVDYVEETVEKAVGQAVEQTKANERTELARNLFKEGSNINFVERVTKLPIEIIVRLQTEINNE
ncbi:MAG: hypothetical protein LBS21_00065 [Clostridiales bacterium]|jgi:hypothetical protein|nr:hypothetical protein [Clostridiales bacterium]